MMEELPAPALLHELPAVPQRDLALLREQGFVVVRGLVSEAVLARADAAVRRLLQKEGATAGCEFRQEPGVGRLAALVGKDAIFRQLISDPKILSYVAAVLGDERLKLSSVNARVVPGADEGALGGAGRQPLHADFNAVEDELGAWVCNVLVALAPYDNLTGPLRAVPGSARFGRVPADDMADLTAPHPNEVHIFAQRGDCIIMNAHTWHSGMSNRSPMEKPAVHLFWCRRDKPQQQYQRELIPPEVQAGMTELERWICALDSQLNDEIMALQVDGPQSGAMEPTRGQSGSTALRRGRYFARL